MYLLVCGEMVIGEVVEEYFVGYQVWYGNDLLVGGVYQCFVKFVE